MKNEKENCRIEAGSQAENQMTSVNKAKSEGRFFFYFLTLDLHWLSFVLGTKA